MMMGNHPKSFDELPDCISSVSKAKISRHFLFWREGSYFGLSYKNTCIFANLIDYKDLEVSYWSRAKGPGSIHLMLWPKEPAKNGAVNFCGALPFSDLALEQFVQIADEVGDLFDYKIKVIDCGPDY